MTDQFEGMLASALAPPDRDPDRAFVAQVQARVLLHEALRAERRGALQRLGLQLLAIVAVAAALLLLSRSPEITEFVAESPAVVLAAVIALFSLLIGLFASRTAPNVSARAPHHSFSKA